MISQSADRMAALAGVAEAVDAARELVDRVLVHRVLVTRSSQVATESLVRGALASAGLDALDGPDRVAAQRVYAELPRLRAVWRTSPRQALARLHLLAAAGLVEDEQLGRPVSPSAAAALGGIAELSLSRTAAPAVVLAAMVHGELLAAAPFAAGNGLVARAAARLMLADRGLDPGLLTVPEVGHVELADYLDAAGAYALGDGRPWMLHCAAAVRIGARESLAVAEALTRG